MQDILANNLPGVLSQVSTGNKNFETVLSILLNSAIAAIVVVTLLVPLLWFSIFENWRSRIMEMRQGRSVALQSWCRDVCRSFVVSQIHL